MVDQQYNMMATDETDERSFLGQYQLPGALYELTSTDLPEAIWVKIENF